MIPHIPVYSADQARTRTTFLALLWAFSYPGRVQRLPDDAPFEAVAETLLDLETSYFCPDNHLASYLIHTGARALSPERAAYHFYPVLDEVHLITAEQASVGTMVFPDEAATLIIGARLGDGPTFRLQGPGIPPDQTRFIKIAGVPLAFWQIRARVNHFPLGWDIYLVDGSQVLGIPRTVYLTLVE